MNDERLRQAWQHSGGARLDPDELAALLDGRLPAQRRADLLAQVAGDADAALQLQLAMDLRVAAAAAVAPAPRVLLPARPAARRFAPWLQALAAGLVLVVGAALWLPRPAPDVTRGAQTAEALAPADASVLAVPPAQLRWPAQAAPSCFLRPRAVRAVSSSTLRSASGNAGSTGRVGATVGATSAVSLAALAVSSLMPIQARG